MAKKDSVVVVPQEDAPPVLDPLAPEKPVTKGPEMPSVVVEEKRAPKPPRKLWDVHYGKGGLEKAVPGYDESEAKARVITDKRVDPLKVGFVVLPHKA